MENGSWFQAFVNQMFMEHGLNLRMYNVCLTAVASNDQLQEYVTTSIERHP